MEFKNIEDYISARALGDLKEDEVIEEYEEKIKTQKDYQQLYQEYKELVEIIKFSGHIDRAVDMVMERAERSEEVYLRIKNNRLEQLFYRVREVALAAAELVSDRSELVNKMAAADISYIKTGTGFTEIRETDKFWIEMDKRVKEILIKIEKDNKPYTGEFSLLLKRGEEERKINFKMEDGEKRVQLGGTPIQGEEMKLRFCID